MPDRRTHRGPHPEDGELFGSGALPQLGRAAADLAWLLSRGYGSPSAQKLVGDRYRLTARQRTAVARCTCSEAELAGRAAREVGPHRLRGRPLWLDGYNVLTTVEAALGGGVVLAARDGTYRDMASMHGSYRKVAETRPALELVARAIAEAGASECLWYLDRAVSNSGRLKEIILEAAAQGGCCWGVELVKDPDPILAETDEIVATADSAILDHCRAWFNLAREVIGRHVGDARIVNFVGTRSYPGGIDCSRLT